MRIVIAAALVLASSLSAFADDHTKAEAYFDAGDAAFRAQNFSAAAEQFELAYKELALPEIAFSAAQSYRRQYFIEPKPEYVKRAVELYRVYLDHVKTGGRVGDASDGLAEMTRELERLTATGAQIGEVQHTATRIAVTVGVVGEKKAQLGEVAVMPATDKTGATATLDGKPMELFSPVAVTPGDHTVVVTAPGYATVTETRHVVESATELVAAELVPKPARVTVTTEAGARVAVNGRVVGTAPLALQELPPGSYLVTSTRRGREPVGKQVALSRDTASTIDLPMTYTAKRRAVPWLAIGAGVLAATATTSIIFAEHYDSTMSSIDGERTTTGITTTQLATYRSAVGDRDGWRDVAFGTGGAAIVTAVIALGLYYFDTPTDAKF